MYREKKETKKERRGNLYAVRGGEDDERKKERESEGIVGR